MSTSADPLEAEMVMAGERSPAAMASELAAFIDGATRALDVAIYDFEADRGSPTAVAQALQRAVARGVEVRVAFNLERVHRASAPRPPRSEPEAIDGLAVPTRPVRGQGTLMHHKYVVRDGETVWTGSMNWTDDAFGLEENIILRIHAPRVAAAFERDFRQLWAKGSVERSGGAGTASRVGGSLVRPYFSPKGPALSQLAAAVIATARRRIRVLSPVITAGAVLGTLAEFAGRAAFDLAGAYDWTQMEEVQAQWRAVPANHWKIAAWHVISPRLSGKHSTPYGPGSPHDYMHAKAVVADDEVVAGSYNLSRHGDGNAENVLHIRSAEHAHRIGVFAERVAERYRA